MRGRRRRHRGALAGALVAIALLVAACGPPAPPPPPACVGPGAPPDAVTSAVFNATNVSRAGSGLGALAWNPQLWCLASDWSNQMAASASMRHRDLGSVIRSPEYRPYRTLGENILHGPDSMTGDAMHAAWMGSAPHAANILSAQFSSFAFAYTLANGQVWATENFGG